MKFQSISLSGVCLAFILGSKALLAQTTSIAVDGGETGPMYYGVGAISGGGGNSRLLIDYPAAQQGEILDYMFKPGYGANLQIMKVEIGGGANSTSGAEATIEPTRGAVNCNCGYEFWLMTQAKARNPDIKFIALAWTSPGWIGSGEWFSSDGINYIVEWVKCAQAHGLTISYLGGKNEGGVGNVSWWQQLRKAVDAAGFTGIQFIGGDGTGQDWSICSDLSRDATWASLTNMVSIHYPCFGNDGGDAHNCPVDPPCTALNKPLWIGEGGSQEYNTGSPAVIRSITRGFIDGRFTSFLNWPLIGAMYTTIPYSEMGLIEAHEPWSGNYSVGKTTWVTAHVTQFTRIGWTYVPKSCGYLGGSEANGTYITLKSPSGGDYSIILETTTATRAQTVAIASGSGLSKGAVQVWATNLGTMDSTKWFVRQTDPVVTNGSFTLTMQPNFVYTVSTLSGAGKGAGLPPHRGTMGLPYADDFGGYPAGSEAKFLSNLQGDFQIQPRADGGGNSLRQMLDQTPQYFFNPGPGLPWAVLGDEQWTNYTVSVDALFEKAGKILLAGRVTGTGGSAATGYPTGFNGYYLQIDNTGAWTVNDFQGDMNSTVKAGGTVAAPGLNTWVTLSLTMNGTAISASINGNRVANFTSNSHDRGQVGFGMLGFQTDRFANLSILPAGSKADGVVFYQNVSYGGAAGQPLLPGAYVASQLAARGIPASWASSVQVPDGWKVIVYSGDNFTGTSWTISSSTADLGSLKPAAGAVMKSCKIESAASTQIKVAAPMRRDGAPRLTVLGSADGYAISLQPSNGDALPYSLSVYDMSGKCIARFADVAGACILWKGSQPKPAPGLYFVKARLPGGKELSGAFTVFR